MKPKKVDIDILIEGLANITRPVKGRKHKFLPSYIGAVEIQVGKIYYGDGDFDYEVEYYLAAQLSNGPIVAVRDDGTIMSLANQLFVVHWGEYPIDFPEEAKTRRPCPRAFIHNNPNCKMVYIPIEELPF